MASTNTAFADQDATNRDQTVPLCQVDMRALAAELDAIKEEVAMANVLANSVLAEVLTNLHSFVAIVPNHSGEDIPRFDRPTSGRDEFYLRQILGSANYKTGGDWNGFLHGWLNYQIEHHLWPDAPLRQVQRVQPHVKAICEKHGVPYLQESVFTRLRKTVDIMVGNTSQPRRRTSRGDQEITHPQA